MKIDSTVIMRMFDALNNRGIEYVLIKNLCNELPDNLPYGKDIDILVRKCDIPAYETEMSGMGFVAIRHPQCVASGWRMLYGADDPTKKKLPNSLEVDMHTSLCVESLMGKAWVPMDKAINDYMWEHREWSEGHRWWQMDDRALLVYMLARCVFDKKIFSEPYRAEISNRRDLLGDDIVMDMMEKVFFGYAPRMIKMVREERFNEIVDDYLHFDEY